MEFKLYEPYKTRGGRKAVLVHSECNNAICTVWHAGSRQTKIHDESGKCSDLADPEHALYDLIEPWTEPRTWTAWVCANKAGGLYLSHLKPADSGWVATKRVEIPEGRFDD